MDRVGIPSGGALHRCQAQNAGFTDRLEDGCVVGAAMLSGGDLLP